MHASMHVLWAGAAALCVALTACSERSETLPRTPALADEAPFKPSVNVASLQKLSSHITAAGIPTRYDAYFDGQQLKLIVEARQGLATTGHGEYMYLGARLLEYTGGALPGATGDAGEIELRFDPQGSLLSARDPDDPGRTIERAEIDGLRARAELLRSHALTQRSISGHQPTGEGRG